MWVLLLFCTLLGARYANAVTVKVSAYGQVFCDAAKSTTPSTGSVYLFDSDPVDDDWAWELGPGGIRPSADLERKDGRFEVGGYMKDGLFEQYVEPYLFVTGNCGGRLMLENYYLPCTTGGVFKDIIVILDGKDDNVYVCQ